MSIDTSEDETIQPPSPQKLNEKARISRMLMVNDPGEWTDSEAIESLTLEEAIVDLYLSIKIRKEEEEIDDSLIKNEKEHLRDVDSFVILEYIRNSFEILANMKYEEYNFTKENVRDNPKSSNDQSARTGIDTQICSEPENNDYE